MLEEKKETGSDNTKNWSNRAPPAKLMKNQLQFTGEYSQSHHHQRDFQTIHKKKQMQSEEEQEQPKMNCYKLLARNVEKDTHHLIFISMKHVLIHCK